MDLSSTGASTLGSSLSASLPSRSSIEKSLSQGARLLTVTTALEDAALVVERISGREALNEDFHFELQCLSSNAHLELKTLIGEEITLRLLLADSTHRAWHGIVTEAAQLGSDGALARYSLRMQPWTAYLALRRNSRIFQDKTVEQITEELLADYPGVDYQFRLTDALPPRSLTLQYRETDHAFLNRLLAAEGISYHFEHQQDDGAGQRSSTADTGAHTRHRLILHDAHTPIADNPQNEIRYHRIAATESDDTIQSWQRCRTTQTNRFTRASWDYKQLLAPAGSTDLDPTALGGAGATPELEDYDGAQAYRHPDAHSAERSTTFLAQYHALTSGLQRLRSSARQFAPGTAFTVTGHPELTAEAARHILLVVQHEAANNLDSESTAPTRLGTDSTLERGTYRNSALCVAASLPIVPPPPHWPRMPGLQTALIVGPRDTPPGTGTHSDRDTRLKIQFPWQRGPAPNPGGLTQATERATADEANGTWVRLARSLAGPNWGTHFTARIGTEVLIDFLDADPDRPIIVGQLHNGQDTPPWPAGERSGANHPGILAGLHAPTLDGGDWNQLLLDDATGQLRTRLATSPTAAQLNLGYLISQTPTGTQRGPWRGQGYELRTDAWQITRAPKGLLITTSARPHSTATQLDTTESAGQLKAALDAHQRLSQAAQQSGADPLAQAPHIDTHRTTVHPEDTPQDGTGTPERSLQGFTEAIIHLEAPANIATLTPQSTTAFAGQHLITTTQADTQITAEHTASLIAGEAASLYTHAGGIKAIAANSPVSLEAHVGPMEVLADQSVTVTSSNDEIQILANKKIVLQAGQSSITLEGAHITFACPGKFEIKATQKAFKAGESDAAEPEALATGKAGQQPNDLELFFHYDDLSPVVRATYKVTFEDGTVLQGSLDDDGYKLLRGVPPGRYTVEYGEDARPWQAPPLPADDAEFARTEVQTQGRSAIEAMLARDPSGMDDGEQA